MLYVATADTSADPELAMRVREHQERRPATWGTVLASGKLSEALDGDEGWGAILVDSLTLWMSATVFAGDSGEQILGSFDEFLDVAEGSPTPLVLVSDEVGFGVVPESAAGRRFRDLLGLVNQRAASVAAEVHLCVAGLGIRIK